VATESAWPFWIRKNLFYLPGFESGTVDAIASSQCGLRCFGSHIFWVGVIYFNGTSGSSVCHIIFVKWKARSQYFHCEVDCGLADEVKKISCHITYSLGLFASFSRLPKSIN